MAPDLLASVDLSGLDGLNRKRPRRDGRPFGPAGAVGAEFTMRKNTARSVPWRSSKTSWSAVSSKRSSILCWSRSCFWWRLIPRWSSTSPGFWAGWCVISLCLFAGVKFPCWHADTWDEDCGSWITNFLTERGLTGVNCNIVKKDYCRMLNKYREETLKDGNGRCLEVLLLKYLQLWCL